MTLATCGLSRVMRSRTSRRSSERTTLALTFHVVVPMTHPTGAWSEGSAHAAAPARLAAAVERFKGAGLDVTAEVGDASPVAAVGDALIAQPDVDEIIVSTLPEGSSVWLSNNVVRRITREHPHYVVTHVSPVPVSMA